MQSPLTTFHVTLIADPQIYPGTKSSLLGVGEADEQTSVAPGQPAEFEPVQVKHGTLMTPII